jgi:predicted esterase
MKAKVLCLHGYAMNSAWLREWCGLLEQSLANEAVFLYPQGPIECTEEEVRATTARFNMPIPESRIGPGLNWCWYRATEDKPSIYLGIDETLAGLAELFEREGPIAGVLGWSQGAVMTAILAALMLRESGSPFRFDWAVLCGGFLPGDQRYRSYFEPPLSLPTLHVLGMKESDFMKQQGERLLNAFADSERLDTPMGHIMPVKHPRSMEAMAEWMRRRLL